MSPREVKWRLLRWVIHNIFNIQFDRVCCYATTMRATIIEPFQNVFTLALTQVLLPCRILLNQRFSIIRVILWIILLHIFPFLFGVGVRHEVILTFLLSKAMSSRPLYQEHTCPCRHRQIS